ncbi:MAG TPA: oligosaccharide flippase family protein [Sphingomicrobium sp.]
MIASARTLVSGRQAFVRAGLWSLLLRVSGMTSGFALGVVLARILGPTDFGIYGLVTTLSAVGMTIAGLGTPQLAVRELSIRSAREDWAGAKTIIYEFGAATSIAGFALAAFALMGASFAGVSSFERMLVVQGCILALLTTYTGLLAAELRGLGALIKGQAMDITVRPALAFVIVGTLLLAGGKMNAMIALIIQNCVASGAAIVSLVWVWRAIPDQSRHVQRSAAIPWIRTALPLGAVDVLRQFDGSYGIILVGWFSSSTELGVFRVAFACAVLATMPVTIFHILLAPTLSRLHGAGDKNEMQRLLSWTAAAMTVVMVPATAAAWLIGRPVIIFVFGAAYANAWLPLALLTTAQLVYALFGMGPILLAMCGGERALIRAYALAIGLAVVTAIPLTLVWGAKGTAVASLVSAIVIGNYSRWYGRRDLGVEITFIPGAKKALRSS